MAIMFNPAISSGVSFQGKKNKVHSNAIKTAHVQPATAKTVGSKAGHNMRMLVLGLLSFLGVGTTQLFTSCTKDNIDIDIPVKPPIPGKDSTVVKTLTAPQMANAWYKDSLKLGTPISTTDKIKKMTLTTKAGVITEILFNYDKSTNDVQVTNQTNYTKKYPNDKSYSIVEYRKNSIGGLDEIFYHSDKDFSTKIGEPATIPHKMKSAKEGVLNYGDGLAQGPVTRTISAAKDSLVEKTYGTDAFVDSYKVNIEYISSAAQNVVSAAPPKATFVATVKDIEKAALKSAKKASKVVR